MGGQTGGAAGIAGAYEPRRWAEVVVGKYVQLAAEGAVRGDKALATLYV